jgi:hypothetical protein
MAYMSMPGSRKPQVPGNCSLLPAICYGAQARVLPGYQFNFFVSGNPDNERVSRAWPGLQEWHRSRSD